MDLFAKLTASASVSTVDCESLRSSGDAWVELCKTMGDGFVGFVISLLVASIVLCIISIIAMWKIFKKAGYEGWKSIIPFYNIYLLLKIAGYNGWFFLFALIPFVGVVIVEVMLGIGLAKNFGKGTGFAVGLILLNFVFELILGFGDAKYVGPNPGPLGVPKHAK